MVDKNDVGIIEFLIKEPFASNEKIGRRIGLSGMAVKNRIAELEKIGVLVGFHVLPSATIFNRHARFFMFRSTKCLDAFNAAMRIDSVVSCILLYDDAMIVLVYDQSAKPKAPLELVEQLGPPVFETSPLFPPPIKAKKTKISIAELKVLMSIVVHPRISLTKIAEDTGYTMKTIRISRNRLIGNDLIHVSPSLQSAHSQGLQFCVFVVSSSKLSDLEKLNELLPHCNVIGYLESPPGAVIQSWAKSLAEIREFERTIRSVPNFTNVIVLLDVREEFARLRVSSWIDEKIQALKKEGSSRVIITQVA